MGEADSLGKRVAAARKARGWKQEQLASEAGISVTFLSEVENDRRTPGADTLLGLAEALEMTIDYLMKGEATEPPRSKPLVIPPQLASFAEKHGLTFSDATDLLKAERLVVARRSRTGEPEAAARTEEYWRKLYEWYKASPR